MINLIPSFIIFLFAIVLFLYLLLLIDTLRGHDIPTSRKAIKTIYKIISENKPQAKNFYDLGCGRGTLVVAVKRRFPHFNVYAIDNSLLRIFFAKLKSIFLGKEICFKKKDLFKADLRDADIVYAYLWYDLLPPLEKKLQKELKKGTVVITNTFCFPNWKPIETYVTNPQQPKSGKLFFYVKN